MRARIFAAMSLTAALSFGCGQPVDLTKTLEVQDISTGWLDSGMVNGQNKLVPFVSFKVKNGSDQTLSVLQVNALFRRVSEDSEWGSGFVTVAGSSGLAPGATSEPLRINSQLGYTGTEPRQQMLANAQFVDAKVQLFAKYASTQWAPVGEYPISRTLLSK
jgi:hypothetical protein